MASMTSLKRDPKRGDWVARKGIPKDIREAYGRMMGGSWEASFRRPGNLSATEAKRQFSEWLAEVEGRISRLRSEASGEGTILTTMQARALSGEWYRWFLAQHEQEPGEALGWELHMQSLTDLILRYAPSEVEQNPDEDPEWSWKNTPKVRRAVDRLLTPIGKVEAFLAEKDLVLAPDTRETFAHFLSTDFHAAMLVLMERCGGVYKPDRRLATFPKFETKPVGGLTCWGLFESWVELRKPAPATVNRWRCVFQDLESHFPGRAAASIKDHEARTWKDGLMTQERSAATVRDIWVNSSNAVFGWAQEHRKIPSNPFANLKVDVPRATKTRESQAFTEEEVGLILRATTVAPEGRLAQHHQDTRRWVPWLCAYTGARPGEMTQLRGQDVKQVQGAWVATITPEAGSVKTGMARTVPLHEHLIEQGFLDFVGAHGAGPLFYDPEGSRKRRSEDTATNPAQTLSAKSRVRLGEWVREVGVTDPEVRPNHAWRHTFKRRAARAGLEKRIRDAFCGHAPETVGDQYDTAELVDLIEAVKRFPRYALEGHAVAEREPEAAE